MSEHAKIWKDWRTQNLMSQVDFARVLGLSRRTIQNIEGGAFKPNWTSQMRFRDLKKRYDDARSK